MTGRARLLGAAVGLGVVALVPGTTAGRADDRPRPVLSPSRAFAEQEGAALYANICQGCHMRDGRGAVGAGRYPSLDGDPNLQSADFTIAVVLSGLRAMPPIGRSMSDDQVAAVVSYVRGRFGAAGDPVSPQQVKAARP